jgi:hypothetical protein
MSLREVGVQKSAPEAFGFKDSGLIDRGVPFLAAPTSEAHNYGDNIGWLRRLRRLQSGQTKINQFAHESKQHSTLHHIANTRGAVLVSFAQGFLQAEATGQGFELNL